MPAISLKAPGGLDHLQLIDIEPRPPGAGEVQVEIKASSLNFHDYVVVTGLLPTEDGRIPMSDGAGVVTAVGGDHHSFGFHAFGEARGYGQHDTVTERHDGLLHGLFGVVTFGNVSPALEQIALEELVHEVELHNMMRNAMALGVELGEGNLLGVVLGAVIEGKTGDHFVRAHGFVEDRDRVHASTEQHADLHY